MVDLAGMGRVAQGMSDMRDNMDRQRLNAQSAEANALQLRKLQQDEMDRKRAYKDNVDFAQTMVVGADGVSRHPISAPATAQPPAATPAPATTGGAQTTPLPPQNLPVGRPITPDQDKLAQLRQRETGTMPGHFYNTAIPSTGKSIADTVLAGYDQAAPALLQKWRHGIKLTPEEQNILGNAPSTPPEIKQTLKFTPIARSGGTVPTTVAHGAPAASAPAASAPPPAGTPPTTGSAPASLRPEDMRIDPAVQAARDAKAGVQTAAEYSDPAQIQSDLAMINAELGKRGLNTETRAMLKQEQRRLQAALDAPPAGGAGSSDGPVQASVPAAQLPATPQAVAQLDPNIQYAVIASNNPDAARNERRQMAQFLMTRIQNSRDPAQQAAFMQQLQQLKIQDTEANIYQAYAGAKTGNPQAWEALAGVIHQQTGSQVGFANQNGNVIMYQQGPDGKPVVIDQGPVDQMASKLYGFLSPSMRAAQLELAATAAKAEAEEGPKRTTEAMKLGSKEDIAVGDNQTRVSVAQIMANAQTRAAVLRAGVNPNEIKDITVTPTGEIYMNTPNGVFKYFAAQTDDDVTSPARFEPIAIGGFASTTAEE